MNTGKIRIEGFNSLFTIWLENYLTEKCNPIIERSENMHDKTYSADKWKEELTLIINLKEIKELYFYSDLIRNKNINLIIWWSGSTLNEKNIFELLNRGVKAIVLDENGAEEIIDAINYINIKGYYYNDQITVALLHYCKRAGVLKNSIVGPGGPFVERERQMIEMRSSGMTAIEIGNKLFLSKKTIDKIFGEMYRRFECSNFFELLRIYETNRNKTYIDLK